MRRLSPREVLSRAPGAACSGDVVGVVGVDAVRAVAGAGVLFAMWVVAMVVGGDGGGW